MFSAATKTAAQAGGYKISRSLRFNSASTQYLNRTPASAGNRQKWTWSGWVKLSSLDSNNGYLFTTTNTDITNAAYIYVSGNTIRYWDNTGSGGATVLVTTAVYRDVSAWYHILLAVDTTQATSSNRARLYVNGSEVTAFSTATYPTQNTNSYVNDTVAHYIAAAPRYFNGYMTEINFVDGQQLTPSSFGQTDAQTGVWGPKAYSGSYGTNGFYLNFSDNSNTTAATLGKDYSGNGNNWTPNNFSVAAGTGNSSYVDTPTNYGTDTGAGGEVRGNYATCNPIDVNGTGGTGITLSNGNLQLTGIASNWRTTKSTVGMSSGKWYCETVVTSISGSLYAQFGICTAATNTDSYLSNSATGWVYLTSGQKANNSVTVAYGSSWTINDVIGIAFDADNGTLTFYKNGVSQGTAYSSLTSGPYFFAVSLFDPQVVYINFGQRPFAYTAPSGYKALVTQNLPTPTVGATTATQAGKYFNPVLYTGNSSTQAITGVGFQPDFIWTKMRSNAQDHGLVDAVRGGSSMLFSNLTAAQDTSGTWISAFSSDGYTIGSATNVLNGSGYTYVAWNWKANGSGVSNTAGSITSTVSANTTSGFSVVTYTGTGANATVGHGLGVAPSMVIVKKRNGTGNWIVWSTGFSGSQYLCLNLTGSIFSASTVWNSATPTSSVLNLGTDSDVNQSTATYMAYCFAPIAGYSAFGSYTGNGSTDGAFIYTGFRPAFVLIKSSSAAGSYWLMMDNKRNTYNVENARLFANNSDAENTALNVLDFLSNGIKLRTTDGDYNGNGGTYIYACFAENPFKYSLAR